MAKKMIMHKIATRISIVMVCLMVGCGGNSGVTISSTPASMPSVTTYALFETSMGNFKVELFKADAPKTVENFVKLTNQGFYNQSATNKIIFHRIMKEFMVQTGDPTGTGSGGPGYKFDDELPIKRSYDPGIVAMANAGPNTNGSQFFICTGAQARNLNNTPNYTQFGKVVEGMDVVLKIAAVPVTVSPFGELSKPVNPPYIINITVQ